MTTKISQPVSNVAVTTNVAANGADLVLGVVDPNGSRLVRLYSLNTVFSKVNITMGANNVLTTNNLVLSSHPTPANANATYQQGSFFSDGSYLYFASANNTLKRVAISSF